MDKQNKTYFHDDLLFLDEAFTDQIDFFEFIGKRLFEKGIVRASFTQGIIEREQKYPTGLPMNPDAVAVPHCDPIHVLHHTVSIVRLRQPIRFFEMGTTDRALAVRFVFVLTMKSASQVPILQDLIALFGNRSFMRVLSEGGAKDIIEYIRKQ